MEHPDTPPFVGTDVEYVGVAKLKILTSTVLAGLHKPLVILPPFPNQDSEPVAVIISWRQYATIQRLMQDYILEHAGDRVALPVG